VSTEAAPAVEARGVRKHFGHAVALKGVDLTLPQGEYLTLFGPNGAGKTTLVRILATLARPSAGEIRLFGLTLSEGSGDLRRRIGVVSHKSFLYRSLTAHQNLLFYARMFDLDDPQRRVEAILERVGLAHRMHDAVETFSRGLEQRCAIARALIHEPDLLLFDEPFTGLDPEAADQLVELLHQLHDSARTVLLTSHDLNRGAEMADQIAILASGRITYLASRREFTGADLADLYRTATLKGRA
jgi:heme exporter protein A